MREVEMHAEVQWTRQPISLKTFNGVNSPDG
jgi:hypothetical protein